MPKLSLQGGRYDMTSLVEMNVIHKLTLLQNVCRNPLWNLKKLDCSTIDNQATRLVRLRRMSTVAGKRVYVTRRVPYPGVELLKEAGCAVSQWDSDKPVSKHEIIENIKMADALFCLLSDKIDKEVISAAGPNMKVIGTMSVGYEHIALAECSKLGIKIGYTPDILTDATAELGMALLLATARRIPEATEAVKSGEWSTWSPSWMCGKGLSNSTVGIVGLGRIGTAVARRVRPFGNGTILYSGRSKKPYDTEVGATYVTFEELLKLSDFVIATLPVGSATKELFNKTVFAQMKKTAIFINISRGALVNQDDLYEALETKQIAAAGLDVTTPEPLPTDHPLLKLKNCVVLPHIGSATLETRSAMAELTARNILAGLRGQPMPSPLDMTST